jgi:hypothetical protein
VLYGGIGFSWRYDANYKKERMSLDEGGNKNQGTKKAEKRKIKNAKTH